MTRADKSRQLTVAQENAIDLLLQGQSDRQVAEQVGVSRPTVTDWRNHHAAFQAELNRRRQEVWGGQTERLRGLVCKAVDVLAEDLDSEDSRLRQGAAIHVLKTVGLYGADLEPHGSTNPRAIERTQQSSETVDALLDSLRF